VANNKNFVVKNGLTVGTDATIGSTLYVSTVDTTDSSAITIVPSTTFNSDVTVENDLRVTNAIENTSGNTILPAVLGNADQVLTVNADGNNASWKSISDVFGGGIDNVVDDTTPQLGGNLDLNSQNITGTGSISITGNVTVDGILLAPTIDTTDSSAITVIPSATFNSDVTIENDLRVTNDIENSSGETILPSALGTAGNVLKVNSAGDGVEWVAPSSPSGFTEEFPTVTNGSANVTMGDSYTLDQMIVYLNGVKLRQTSEYTVSGTTLTIAENLVTGDIVNLIVYTNAVNITGVTSLTGTANEVEVDTSTGGVTVGLPNDVTIGNELTVTTGLFTPLIDTTDSSALSFNPAVTFNSDVTVENDLSVNGTVNNRDIATDGAKLDTVDPNAINIGKAVAMAIVFG